MKKFKSSRQQLENEIMELKVRLDDADETLLAVRHGKVDAFVISSGDDLQTFSLSGADHPYREMVEAINAGVVTLSSDGTIIFCNPQFSEMVHKLPEKLLGTHFKYLFSLDERVAFEFLLEASKKSKASGEFSLQTAPSVFIQVQLSISKLKLEGFIGFSIIITDITEGNSIRQALHQKESILQNFYESVPMLMGVVELTKNDEIIHLDDNPATAAFFNTNYQTTIGKSASDIGASQEAIQKWIEAYRQSQRLNRPIKFQYGHPTQLGQRWLSVTVSLIGPTQSGNIQFSYVAEDITDQKHKEEQIKLRTDELHKLYDLARALTNADDLNQVLGIVTKHAVESISTTFAFIGLIEGEEFVTRSAFPVRSLDHSLKVGKRVPLTDLPFCHERINKMEPLILRESDKNLTKAERDILLLDYAHTVCLFPLSFGSEKGNSDHLQGFLIFGEERNEQREDFTVEKQKMAISIADQASTTIRRMLLVEKTMKDAQFLGALHLIDVAINTNSDLELTLDLLLGQVIDLLHVDAAAILRLESNSQTLKYFAGKGFQSTAIKKSKLQLGKGIIGGSVNEQRVLWALDLQSLGKKFPRAKLIENEGFKSYCGMPLISKGKVIGLLEAFSCSSIIPTQEWKNIIEAITDQASIAMDSAILFEDLQRSNNELLLAYEKTIEGWSGAVDLRDHETEGHSKRVVELTLQLARAHGISDDEYVHIQRGALLHDIGKIGIPDSILLKPGPLTDEEWVMMRKHPVFAYDLLSEIEFLKPALDIPYCHHEKWDGTGYPRGLKGEQIPIPARLFAIADVWDALRSDRPYRDAWSEEKIIQHIQSSSGSHFDPKVVELFLGLVEDGTWGVH